MDSIELARELGKQIQKEEIFIKFQTAQKAVEDDNELQEQIADFNMKRYELTKEVAKEQKDEDKIAELDKTVREMYSSVTGNQKMIDYNNAQDEFNDFMDYIEHILSESADGKDPDKVEKPEIGCTGDCSSCGGCH